ncbi:VOC family protein [Sorangium cellulosum]|uniref:Glyxoylase n=1 Tax=Sorangium cellulosum TaxID=56 RepID=A0A150QAU2_SORCE|nr:VOC family protein [Sorangium cellulosum]KYF64866.1 glyxoylase [Sorangium cellulosum]
MTKSQVHPVPEGQTCFPYLSTRNAAEAIGFYERAFGARAASRIEMPDGRLGHAELSIGRARFFLSDEYPDLGAVGPQTLGGTSVSVVVYVEDVDALVAQAAAAGATIERPPQDQPHGDRMAWIRDPYGHRWGVASRIEAVSPEEMQKRLSAT